MTRVRVIAEGTSQFIHELIHDDETLELIVRFSDGKAFQYLRVPTKVFEGFIHAESLGHYFNEKIYGQFSHRPITIKDIHREVKDGPTTGKTEEPRPAD